ncbi:hypothetical protein NDU88_004529 [Pleurodeles waltl]|uniref:Secreted protein n=1 Tax=Pleurodeles waltl TaxID=8319 RepID=A0AAV7V5E5_PLEWA|nr:hypothetical protein NDU88_004529 [Pleurodeles waltl]
MRQHIVATALVILFPLSRQCGRVDRRCSCRSSLARAYKQSADLWQQSWLLGLQCPKDPRAGLREHSRAMPPKNSREDQLKPGSNRRSPRQSLSLGLSPNIENTGKKPISKIHGASEDKLPAPVVDDGSRSMTKTTSVGHPEGKPIIPEMFKHSQHISRLLS